MSKNLLTDFEAARGARLKITEAEVVSFRFGVGRDFIFVACQPIRMKISASDFENKLNDEFAPPQLRALTGNRPVIWR